jgi:hypothetical protein
MLMADPNPLDRPSPDRPPTDPLGADRPIAASPAGESLRPPGPHHIVDPAEVSETPVLSPNAHAVSDAEGELLVTSAAGAGPNWASSRVIAGAVGSILILLTVGVGVWLLGWLETGGEEALRGGVVVAPDGEALDDDEDPELEEARGVGHADDLIP